MKIKRTDLRIKPAGACPYFKSNMKDWLELKEGKTITVSEKEYDEIKEVFGNSIQVVEKSSNKKENELISSDEDDKESN